MSEQTNFFQADALLADIRRKRKRFERGLAIVVTIMSLATILAITLLAGA